jgi:putative DNA primase/helicase
MSFQTEAVEDFRAFLQGLNWGIHAAQEIVPDDQVHRLRSDDDANGKATFIVYSLMLEGDKCFGWVRNHKTQIVESYGFSSKERIQLTPEEKKAQAEKIRKHKEEREKQQQESHEKASEQAQKFWEASEIPFDTHQYLKRKGVDLSDVRERDGDLVIPLRDVSGKLWTYETVSAAGEKRYMPGGKKKGCFYLIAKERDDFSHVFVCEGVTTGASIRAAVPSSPVFCAMDAGNLEPVAREIRSKYKNATIIIACDNDRFGEKNTGVESGQKAAMAVSGHAFIPQFKDNDPKRKLTDYNDLHSSEGESELREQILAGLSSLIVSQPESPATDLSIPSKDEGVQTVAGGEISKQKHRNYFRGQFPFRILGLNDGDYYYYSYRNNTLVSLTPREHSAKMFMQFMTKGEFELAFDGSSTSQKEFNAAAELMNYSNNLPFFDKDGRVRGIGVWMDLKRRVLHCGSHLYVDGVRTEISDFESSYIYRGGVNILNPSTDILPVEESRKLLKLCRSFKWEDSTSGLLLAGWMAIAPICSALPWRPHIWITGEPGAGKSTILRDLIKKLLLPISLNVRGGTTEAGIRKKLGADARPIVYDEAESNDNKNRIVMDGILDLCRRASSNDDDLVLKYGQDDFSGKFCMCLAAIVPNVRQVADETRISILNLIVDNTPGRTEKFAKLKDDMIEVTRKDYREAMLARIVHMMPVILDNIDTFQEAAERLGMSARVGQQVSALLGGAYMLAHDEVVDIHEAMRIIKENEWSRVTAVESRPGWQRLIDYLGRYIVTATDGAGRMEASIGQLIDRLHDPFYEGAINERMANNTLKLHSINYNKEGYIDIGNSSQMLERILHNTEWAVNWHKVFANAPGAEQRKLVYFTGTDKQRAIRLPIELFVQRILESD